MEAGGRTGHLVAVPLLAVMLALGFAPVAGANKLNTRTMTAVAKKVAKSDCKKTKGCKSWKVRDMHNIGVHKGLGKIKLTVKRNGEKLFCERQIVVKLEHDTGKLFYGLSDQKCKPAG